MRDCVLCLFVSIAVSLAVAVVVSMFKCVCFYRSLFQVCVSIYRSKFLLSHAEHPFVWEEVREGGRESAHERASEESSEGGKGAREQERGERVCLYISVCLSAYYMSVCQGVL